MKLFSNLSKTSRVMLSAIGGACVIMLALGLIIIEFVFPFEKSPAFVIGLAAGCAQSMIKVVLLDQAIGRTLDMEKEHAETFARFQAISRYLLTIAVFAVVILFPKIFGLFGAILGVLSLQFSAYIANFVLRNQNL